MLKNKKLIIAGGSGFIGQALASYFGKENKIIILGRQKAQAQNNAYGNVAMEKEVLQNIKYVQWDGKNQGDWSTEMDGADLVINLAGKSVNCRYTEKTNKKFLIAVHFQPMQLAKQLKGLKIHQKFG